MSLSYLVYVSSAARLMNGDELTALLAQARANNARNGITGMLLYKDGSFMQFIEGEPAALARLHDKILQDARHKGFITLLKGESEERQFGKWTMAFTNVDSLSKSERDSFSDFLNKPFDVDYFGKYPHHALKLPLTFKKNVV